MFDIGWQELLVLGAAAMVIFPPREYPELLRGVVGLLHRLRRMGDDVREGIDDFSQKHLSEQFDSIEGAKRSIGTSFGETQKLLRQSAENTRKQIADIESRAKGKVGGKVGGNSEVKKATSKSKTKAKAPKKAVAKTKAKAPKKAPAKAPKKAPAKTPAKAPKKTQAKDIAKDIAKAKTKVTAKA